MHAVLMAEVVHHSVPRLVELHNYRCVVMAPHHRFNAFGHDAGVVCQTRAVVEREISAVSGRVEACLRT